MYMTCYVDVLHFSFQIEVAVVEVGNHNFFGIPLKSRNQQWIVMVLHFQVAG